jgi:DnaJ-class molecular chaperone
MTSIRRQPRERVKTWYEILDCPPGSAHEALHARYLELAKALHPDVSKVPHAEAQFKLLTAAWGALKDPGRRRNYDARLRLAGGQCPDCDGRGLRWTFKLKAEGPCATCGGTGQR